MCSCLFSFVSLRNTATCSECVTGGGDVSGGGDGVRSSICDKTLMIILQSPMLQLIFCMRYACVSTRAVVDVCHPNRTVVFPVAEMVGFVRDHGMSVRVWE